MTHGDKAKAKADKSNKASVKKVGTQDGENGKSKAASQGSKAEGQTDKAGQSGKTGKVGKAKSLGKAGEGSKASGEKAAAPKKGSAAAKESSSRAAEPKGKGSAAAPAETAGGFANPAINAAFRQALKKYPNALRKLTD